MNAAGSARFVSLGGGGGGVTFRGLHSNLFD